MESTDSFIKEENKGLHEESCGDHHLLLQVGDGDDSHDEMRAASPDLKNFMDCGTGDDHCPIGKKMERSSPESDSRSSSSAKRKQMDDQLIGSSKAELDEVMEENQRLKTYLDRILKDYRTLQMQYQDVVHQEEAKRPLLPEEPDQLFALSLGRSSPSDWTRDERKTPARTEHADQGEEDREGLALGLDCKFRVPDTKKSTAEASPNHSPENSVNVETEEEGGEMRLPKTEKNSVKEIDEIAQQNPVKRARVSVRVRCDTPTMNDGCQWRKYGQKISKGNPCPRAYYRCTVAPSCPVRKQVQRCAEDMSILITTYEGTHSHPLPISATAMASTTSAAASMLMSGSSNSASGPGTSSTTPGSENLSGLNFYLSDNNNSRSKPFYLQNSSISSNPSFPTITLDLTSTTSSSIMSSHLSRLASIPPRQYATTNLNFSSLESNPLPISWSNGMLNYGPQPLNKNQPTSSLSFGAQASYDQTLYQSYPQKNMTNPSQVQSVNPYTIAAATKAITSDPSFQSALAAALSSIIGGSSGGTNASTFLPNQVSEGETLSQINNMKTSEPFPILSSFPSSSSSNTNKCAPSYMNKSSSTTSSSQAPGTMFLNSPPFSSTKSRKSNSPGDQSRDHAA